MRLVLASLLLAGCVPGVSNGNSSSSGSPVDIEQPGGGGSGGGSDSGTSGDTASGDTGGWVDTGGGGSGGVSGRFVAADVLSGGISNPDMGEYPCEGNLEIIVDGGSFSGTANCIGSSAGSWEFTLSGVVDGGSLYGTMEAVLAGWDCVVYEDALVSGGISAEGGYVDVSVISVWTDCGYDYNWDFAAATDLMPG